MFTQSPENNINHQLSTSIFDLKTMLNQSLEEVSAQVDHVTEDAERGRSFGL